MTDDAVELTFNVKNVGKRDGEEVAQVYVTFPDCGVTTPIRQLKGFKRVKIGKGKTEKVVISVPRSELRIWDEKTDSFYTPQGKYLFTVGSASDNLHLLKEVSL